MEERAERKRWIVSFASTGEEDGGFLLFGEMITETVVEDFHVNFGCVDVAFLSKTL